MPMPQHVLETLGQPVVTAVREYLTAPGHEQKAKLELELITALRLAYAQGLADVKKEQEQ